MFALHPVNSSTQLFLCSSSLQPARVAFLANTASLPSNASTVLLDTSMRANLSLLRSLLLARCRLAPSAHASLVFGRSFASGTYLDKPAVTERVLEVLKKFEKVEPAKARARDSLSRGA